VIEKERYAARYLSNANKAAATADEEPTWSNAAWLVKIEEGKPGTFLRGSEISLPKIQKTFKDSKGVETPYELDPFIVLRDGQPVAFDPNHADNVAQGDLLVDATVGGVPVKSSFQLLK